MAKLCCFCPKEMLAPPPHQNGRVWRDFVGWHSNMALVLVGATIIMYKVN